MKVICVIPARYASTRLPGKPLKLIAGKPMIQRVYEQAKKAKIPAEVIVATDDKRVYDTVLAFGGCACMTREDHPNGTSRLAEVAEKYPDVDVIVNVQGDEPMIPPEIIDRLAEAFQAEPELQMATMKTLMQESEYSDPSAVKVITDKNATGVAFFILEYLHSDRSNGAFTDGFGYIAFYHVITLSINDIRQLFIAL